MIVPKRATTPFSFKVFIHNPGPFLCTTQVFLDDEGLHQTELALSARGALGGIPHADPQ